MRICYFGTYEKDYPTNRVLIEGLRQNGVDVVECHVPLWEKTRTKGAAYFGIPSLLFLGLRYLLCCLILFIKVQRVGHIGAIIVGFNGHLDLIPARVVAWLKRCVLVFNPALAIYDAIVIDKGFFQPNRLLARQILRLERFLCRVPDAVFIDTEEHFMFWESTLGLRRGKYYQVYLGADDRLFFPREATGINGSFRVLFYGKFQPMQGVPYVVQAAKLLENDGIEFEIIGSGPDETKVEELLAALRPTNVVRRKWLDPDELVRHIASANLCLGIFGTSPKAQRSIPNKVIQALAMRKTVLTGKTRAMEELLTDREHIMFCPPGDHKAIADCIRVLTADPELSRRIAFAGHQVFLDKCAPAAIGRRAKSHLETLLGHTAPRLLDLGADENTGVEFRNL